MPFYPGDSNPPTVFWCKQCNRCYYIDPMADEDVCPVCGWKEEESYQDRYGFWVEEEK